MPPASHPADQPRLAGIELGGTKSIAVLAEGARIIDRLVVATTTPDETLGALADRIAGWNAAAGISALGIASFGPIRLTPSAPDFGHVLATTKPGWSGAPVFAAFADRFPIPIAIDTDVNAAALAEYRRGAGRDCASLVYVTIGTGVGGGVLINGNQLIGRLHPELGHIQLRRTPFDGFPGICPFHGDCVEGLVSGPALAARFNELPQDVPAGDPRWAAVASDLAQFIAVLIYSFAPQRLLIGGGVGLGSPHLVAQALSRLPDILSGYFPDLDQAALATIVTAPALGADAGPLGAIALAEDALAAHRDQH